MSDMSTAMGAGRVAAPKTAVSERLKHNNFDGLRLIFAAMVVLFHVALLSQAAELVLMERYISSTFAVQAFFFVSGFLVVMSFEKTTSLTSYFKKRGFRIAPAYIFVVLAAAILLAPLSTLSVGTYFSSSDWWAYVASNLALSNFANPTLPGVFTNNFEQAVNGSLWTIKVEVMFYISVPFIVWGVRRFGYKPVLAAVFLGSIAWHSGFLYLGQLTGSDLLTKLAKQLPGQLSFFVGGCYAYYRTANDLPPPPAWTAVLAVAGYALSDGLIYSIIAPVCVTFFTYWAAIGVRQLWSSHRWGDFSYGVYLYHFPIAQALISMGLFAATPVLGLFLVCLLTLIVALASWHLIEKRALRFARERRTAPMAQD
jgi:peptidoglycan/LPS O-acetylase OafA/YrhL